MKKYVIKSIILTILSTNVYSLELCCSCDVLRIQKTSTNGELKYTKSAKTQPVTLSSEDGTLEDLVTMCGELSFSSNDEFVSKLKACEPDPTGLACGGFINATSFNFMD